MSEVKVRTGGVDLAAESARTALAVVEWTSDRAALTRVDVGITDGDIAAAAREVDKLGIDCAFGWPDEFVDFVARHARLESSPRVDGGIEWRRTLAYRETDRFVREATGRWPLSVSTDRLGLTAMHCASLLTRLASDGHGIDRSGGTGLVAEVYPGATLRRWGWHAPGYRTEAVVRRSLIDRMTRETPQLDLGSHAELMEGSADAFDAVIAAFAARAAACGLYESPPPHHDERARREGWIILPARPFSDLLA